MAVRGRERRGYPLLKPCAIAHFCLVHGECATAGSRVHSGGTGCGGELVVAATTSFFFFWGGVGRRRSSSDRTPRPVVGAVLASRARSNSTCEVVRRDRGPCRSMDGEGDGAVRVDEAVAGAAGRRCRRPGARRFSSRSSARRTRKLYSAHDPCIELTECRGAREDRRPTGSTAPITSPT